MKILVTGAGGFIGRNLIAELRNRNYTEIFEFNKNTSIELLDDYTKKCDFVFHLAGINRPNKNEEFIYGNVGFLQELLSKLQNNGNKAPVLMASSIQAKINNPYGSSKKMAENILFDYAKEISSQTLIYRLPNVFGKWARPNYNSVVATFCNNIVNGIAIKVNDPNTIMKLSYIDDVINEFINAMEGKENRIGDYCFVKNVYTKKLGEIAELIRFFEDSNKSLLIPNMGDEFEKRLYSTYLSYSTKEKIVYPLKMNIDNRGSFTEFIKTVDRGQVSVNISRPGIQKGNHWHHTKNEKFLVVKGRALIQLRRIDSDQILKYHVSEEKLEVVNIPSGYTHNIINEGDTDLVTVMWVNEVFDTNKPDTYYLEV